MRTHQTKVTTRLNSKLTLSQLRVLTTLNPKGPEHLAITPDNLETTLSSLGKRPTPARILEALTITRQLELSPPCPPHLQVLRAWLKKHRLASPPAAMAKAIEPMLAAINWPSLCPCPLIGFSLAITPVREGPITLDMFVTSLREKPNTVVTQESINSRTNAARCGGSGIDASQIDLLLALRATLESWLSNLSAISFGFPTRDLYLVGRTAQGQLSGVVTTIIEDLQPLQEEYQGVICPAA